MNTKKKTQKNIYLTGFMASGKSTFGKLLAEKMQRDFVDLDQLLIQKEAKSISEIFKTKGEEYFRKKEREYLLEVSENFDGIIALGGGALQSQEIINHLKTNGVLVFLDTPITECVDRVYNSLERPILFNTDGKKKTKQTLFEELKTLYYKREHLYKQAQVNIETKLFSTIDEMVNTTIEKINNHA